MQDTKILDELAKDIYSVLRSDTLSRAIASLLYDKGWGTQRVGEWVVTEWDGEKFITVPYDKSKHSDPYCSICRNYALLTKAGYRLGSNYCPHCGARMITRKEFK